MRARNGRVGLLTFVLALSVIGLGACGGDDDSDQPDAAPDAGTEAPEDTRRRKTAAPEVTADPASSPFTSTTAFCTEDTATHEGLEASAPGVTADSISVVAIQAPLSPGDSPQGYRFNLGDPVDMLKVFAEMVNECGGINGRDIDLTVVQQEGGAADQATTARERAGGVHQGHRGQRAVHRALVDRRVRRSAVHHRRARDADDERHCHDERVPEDGGGPAHPHGQHERGRAVPGARCST